MQAIWTDLFRGVLCGVARACTWPFFGTTSEKHSGTTASTLLDIPSKYRKIGPLRFPRKNAPILKKGWRIWKLAEQWIMIL